MMFRRNHKVSGLGEVRAALDEATFARTKAQKRRALYAVNSALEIVIRAGDPIDTELGATLAGNPNWSTARVAHIADLLTDQQARLTKELTS